MWIWDVLLVDLEGLMWIWEVLLWIWGLMWICIGGSDIDLGSLMWIWEVLMWIWRV